MNKCQQKFGKYIFAKNSFESMQSQIVSWIIMY